MPPAALLCIVAFATLSSRCFAEWTLLSSASPSSPEIRYSHGAASFPDPRNVGHHFTVITHGYNNAAGPNWLKDSWLFSSATGNWRQIARDGPVPQARYGAPFVSIGESCGVLFGGDDGGHTTSTSYVWGSYLSDVWALDVPTAAASGSTAAWSLIQPLVAKVPEPRTLHAAASIDLPAFQGAVFFGGLVSRPGAASQDARSIANTFEMLVFMPVIQEEFGSRSCPTSATWLVADVGDINSMTFQQLQRYHATEEKPDVSDATALSSSDLLFLLGRHGAAVVVDSIASQRLTAATWKEGVTVVTGWLYGGTRLQCNAVSLTGAPKPCTLDDVWAFKLVINTGVADADADTASPPSATVFWTRVEESRAPGTLPNPRTHHGAVMHGRSLVVFGGALCTPSCTVKSDIISFNVDTGAWRVVMEEYPNEQPPNRPMKRYRHSFTKVRRSGASNSTSTDGWEALVFGGESYKPSKYHGDLWQWQRGSTSSFAGSSLMETVSLWRFAPIAGAVLALLWIFFRPQPAERKRAD